MIRRAKFLLSIFLASEVRTGLIVLGFAFFVSLFEIIGVASMMPFFALIGNPETIKTNQVLSSIYDTLNFESYQSFIFFVGIGVIGIIGFSNVLKGFYARYTNIYVGNLRQSLQGRLLRSYVNQPYKYFLGKNTSELNKIIWSDIEFVISYAVTPIILIFTNLVLLSLAVLLISVVQFKVAVSILVLVTTFALIFSVYLKSRNQNSAMQRGEAAKQSYIVLNEVLGGIKDVKVYQKEARFINKFNIYNKSYAELWAKSATIAQLPKFALETVAFSLLVGVTLIMLYTLKDIGSLLPVLGVYAFAAYKIVPAIQIVFQGVSSIKQGWPSVQILNNDLLLSKTQLEVDEIPEPISFNDVIKLDRISYSYPDSERNVLDELSLEIKCNSTVGIVGGTGAGKTTLVDLLLGLHLPDGGNLSVDGQIIGQSNMNSWKQMIGYVPQNIFLTDATISENIAFGYDAKELDVDKVRRAAELASLHDFIMSELPDKYDTIVGERGVRLSGGQKQRLGIARALYREPQILILDEATSSLDNVTETYIIDALEKLKGACTIVIIAHRFSTIQKSDNIVILKNGKIVDEGVYEALLKNSSEFKKLSLAE